VEQQVYQIHQQGKILFRLAKFSDKLLRKLEMKGTGTNALLSHGLPTIQKSEACLAKAAISSGLQALNMGYLKASDIIPRLLDVLSRHPNSVEREFQEHSKTTPAWLFLRWISQIAAILNRPESSVI
jgi:DNA-dependent protein kinase catalytic subunit